MEESIKAQKVKTLGSYKNGEADACAWGQKFIANPDLVHRFKENLELNEPDSDTFYAEGKKGYTDYPFAD